RRGARQRHQAVTHRPELLEAAKLPRRPELTDIERTVDHAATGYVTQHQLVLAARSGIHDAVDDRAVLQPQSIGAAGEGDGVDAGAAVVGQPAFDRAAVDNGEIRADDANTASAGITVGRGLAVTTGSTGATR